MTNDAQTKLRRTFAAFSLDPVNAQLWRGSKEIRLRRKTFEVLRHLTERTGQLVTKTELLDTVWANTVVSDSMPSICIAELRKALGDDPRKPSIIETVHGRGYRLIAPVALPTTKAATSQPSNLLQSAPLVVGREEELALVSSYLTKAREGARHVVFVTGEPGIGKTTFVRAFLDVAKSQGTTIAHGQCVEQYGQGEPYTPILEALTRLCEEHGGERAIELLDRYAPTWLAQMPSLLSAADRER
jgi:DNA-binding winged helix-turn-helix (wHTH) protein